ncbi:MAG: hypothetical protein LBG48_04785 [Rickettsiales bacterium]|nr:hypothetical protein [Rickettsiales bacterium]
MAQGRGFLYIQRIYFTLPKTGEKIIISIIAELEFLNERSEFRNSSSAIQVTMKTKTLWIKK